jgi:hypothetical protein
MARLRPLTLLFMLSVFTAAAFATIGSFRGKIVAAPTGEARQGWVFVQAPNGRLRLVDVRKAEFAFDEDFHAPADLSPSAKLLLQGAEVRVVGEQQEGEWRALRVEIIRLAASTRGTT